jgi:predicted glycosyltransferase
MESEGHEFFVTARDKDVTHYLLNYYGIKYTTRGRGRTGYCGKMIYIFEADYELFRNAKKFNPDVFLSFGSAYAAHVSKLLGKPHIAFDDTDHAKYEHLMYVPFTDFIHTPEAYLKDFGKKHHRFKGIMELSYLHPKYLDDSFLKDESNSKQVFIRIVSWEASHDFGYSSKNYKSFINLINEISSEYEIIVSSEKVVPVELKKFNHKIPPEKIHNILNKSCLYIGEGGTIANECAILGVPNLLINPISKLVGVHQLLKNKGIQEYFDNIQDALNRIEFILSNISQVKEKVLFNSKKFIAESQDVTEYIINVVKKFN